jgi:NADH-quinone oxidoreductase subunit M
VVIAASLVVPLAVATWLLGAGRAMAHRAVSRVALAASALTLVLVVAAVLTRPTIDRPWVPELGLRWQLAVDGISAPLLLMTALLGVAVVAHSARRPAEGGTPAAFHACLLIVVGGALATFYAHDAVLFFVAFEVVLVPMWVLITRFGDAHRPAARADAGARFVLYTALGSTLMLIGILALVTATGTADLDVLARGEGSGIPERTQLLIALALVVGLGVKVPLFPAHTWLPPAHTIAPTAGSVLLAAVLLKMGTYGLVRLPVAAVPDAIAPNAPALPGVGAVGILWGGLACLVERDLKRLVAYSSVAHMGFVAVGLASGTQTGMQAALFANIAHGVVSALLFFVVGGLKERWGSADLTVARAALREVSPRLGFALLVGLAASLGLPGLAGFWGEFLSLYAAWSPAAGLPVGLFRACAAAGALGTVLAAAYSLRVAGLVWAGERTTPAIADSRGVEWAVVGGLVAVALLLGVLPQLLLSVTSGATAVLMGAGT